MKVVEGIGNLGSLKTKVSYDRSYNIKEKKTINIIRKLIIFTAVNNGSILHRKAFVL